jgi:hypothetical protein
MYARSILQTHGHLGGLMNKQLARYESHKTECGVAQDEIFRVNMANEEKEKKELVGFLTDLGATEIWSNGYVFTFDYADKCWHFVNQTSRICIGFIPIELKSKYNQPTGISYRIYDKPLKALKTAIDLYGCLTL